MSKEKIGVSPDNTPVREPASSIDEIRARLRAIEETTAAKQRQQEEEKASVAEEIIDMEEGNRGLAEKTSKRERPPEGDGYDKMLGKTAKNIDEAESRLREIDRNYTAVKGKIQTLRKEIAGKQSAPLADEQEEYGRLLKELEQQEAELETAYKEEKAEANSVLKEGNSAHSALAGRVDKVIKDMDGAKKDPRKFATETVLAAHKELKSKDYSGQREEIETAVRSKAEIRKDAREAKSELPKMEAYLASVETAFSGFKKTLADSSVQAKQKFDALEADLDGPVKETIREKSEIIKKGRNPGFWARMNKAESKGESAKRELNALKEKLSGRLFSGEPYNTPLQGVYYSLAFSGGGSSDNPVFDENTFSSNFPMYKLKQWAESAKSNPAVFKGMAEKIGELKRRGAEIAPARGELLNIYQGIQLEVQGRYRQLHDKINKMFDSALS